MPPKSLSLSLLLSLLAASTASTAAAVPASSCDSSRVKSCCTSANAPVSQLTDSLGNAVPLLSSLHFSTRLALSCTPLEESMFNGAMCGGDVMCCAPENEVAGVANICRPLQ